MVLKSVFNATRQGGQLELIWPVARHEEARRVDPAGYFVGRFRSRQFMERMTPITTPLIWTSWT